MSLRSSLTEAVRWLRAGYPQQAPRHGYVPLIALMPGSKPAQAEDRLDAEEPRTTLELVDPLRRERPESAPDLRRPKIVRDSGQGYDRGMARRLPVNMDRGNRDRVRSADRR